MVPWGLAPCPFHRCCTRRFRGVGRFGFTPRSQIFRTAFAFALPLAVPTVSNTSQSFGRLRNLPYADEPFVQHLQLRRIDGRDCLYFQELNAGWRGRFPQFRELERGAPRRMAHVLANEAYAPRSGALQFTPVRELDREPSGSLRCLCLQHRAGLKPPRSNLQTTASTPRSGALQPTNTGIAKLDREPSGSPRFRSA